MAKKKGEHTNGCVLHSSDDTELDPVMHSSQRLCHHMLPRNKCLSETLFSWKYITHLFEHKQTKGGYG